MELNLAEAKIKSHNQSRLSSSCSLFGENHDKIFTKKQKKIEEGMEGIGIKNMQIIRRYRRE